MSSLYKVSVIIPVFNAEKYLRRAVESAIVLKETGEILLVDDGSIDKSLRLCEQLSLEHERVRILRHQGGVNMGPAASRNLGIVNADHDFVSFLDSDDYYLPNRFEFEKTVFSEHPDADAVYGCNREVFETDKARELFFVKRSSDITTITQKIEPEYLYRYLLLGGYGEFHISTITIRKSAFSKSGLFDPSLRYGEDTKLWLKMSITCKLYPGNIDEPQAIRTIHESNSIHKWQSIRPYSKQMYESLFDWILKQNVAFNVKNDFFTALYYNDIMVNNSPAAVFFRQLRRNPGLLLTGYFYKKIYLLLKR